MGFWSNLKFWGKQERALAMPPLHSAGLLAAGMGKPTANTLVAFSQVPALYRVADKIARSVARANWKVVRVVGEAGRPIEAVRRNWSGRLMNEADPRQRRELLTRAVAAGQLEILPSHPALDMWQRGTDDFDATTTVYLIELYLLLVGEVYVAVNRGAQSNQPYSLQPFPPTAIDPTSSSNKMTFRLGERAWTYPAKDVFAIRRPHPVDPYGRSLGMAQVLVNELDLDESAAIAAVARFRNGMRPDLLIQVEGADDAGVERTEKKLEQRHRGPGNVGKPIVTNAGRIQVEPLTSSLVDMDLTRLRDQQADTVRETPGVPPEIFGKVTNSNRATIDASDYLYNSHVVDPELYLIMRSMNHRLMPEFAQDGAVFLMYDSPIPADREFQLGVTQSHPGSFSENEKRSLAGLPERVGGELTRGTSFTAGQIQQVREIVIAVSTGQMSRESGVNILVTMYGIEPVDAEDILGPGEFEADPIGGPGDADFIQDAEDEEDEGDEELAPGGNS